MKAGAETGGQLRGQDLEHSARMAAIAQASQEASQRNQIEQQKVQAERDIASNRIQLQQNAAAEMFRQQRMREQSIQNGMDPVQAWQQYPGTRNGNENAGVWGAALKENRQAAPLNVVHDPNDPNSILGVQDGTGAFHFAPKAKAATDAMSPHDKMAANYFMSQAKGIDAALNNKDGIDSRTIPGLNAQKQKALDSLKGLGINLDGTPSSGTPPPPTAAAPGPQGAPPLPTHGQIVNGHKFLGGDPQSPDSWQPLGNGSSFIGTPGQPNQATVPGGTPSPSDNDPDVSQD